MIGPTIDPSEFAIKRLIYDRNTTEVSETMNKTVFFNAISMVSTLKFCGAKETVHFRSGIPLDNSTKVFISNYK